MRAVSWFPSFVLALLLAARASTADEAAAATGKAAAAPGAAQKEADPTTARVEQRFEVDGDVDDDDAASEPDGDYAGAPAQGPEVLLEDWAKYMKGFDPEILLTFPLAPRTDEYFYETLEENGTRQIRGAFFSSGGDEQSESVVDFSVTGPKGKVIYEKKGEAEGLFHFSTSTGGTYTFKVSNTRWLEKKSVTFMLGKGNESALQETHIKNLDATVKAISRKLRDIQTESTYLWIREKAHMKAIENIHTRVLGFCVVEFLIIIGVSAFQAVYIKGLLSDRRVL